jgi:HSP20 family protein
VVKIENKTEHEDKSCKDECEKFHYVRREFSYSNYEQTYTLPEDVNRQGIQAKVENGILTITLPKVTKEEKQKNTRAIEIG